MPTLFPSSMSTTSCWAYSWISASQACHGRAETRLVFPTPLPYPGHTPHSASNRKGPEIYQCAMLRRP